MVVLESYWLLSHSPLLVLHARAAKQSPQATMVLVRSLNRTRYKPTASQSHQNSDKQVQLDVQLDVGIDSFTVRSQNNKN